MANTTGKKFGERKKGTPNVMTSELRNLLKKILLEKLDNTEALYGNFSSERTIGDSYQVNAVCLS